MHALFALCEPKVELINTMFSTIFRDFCRVIDDQWDILVECIATGSIPDSVDVGHLKETLLVSNITFLVRSEKHSPDTFLIRHSYLLVPNAQRSSATFPAIRSRLDG